MVERLLLGYVDKVQVGAQMDRHGDLGRIARAPENSVEGGVE